MAPLGQPQTAQYRPQPDRRQEQPERVGPQTKHRIDIAGEKIGVTAGGHTHDKQDDEQRSNTRMAGGVAKPLHDFAGHMA